MEPLLEVVLLTVTAIDLKNGAEPDWKHGLAAVCIGFTVGLGHHTIKWVDARVAHRFAGGPPPARAPKYGTDRMIHERRTAARWITAAVVAMGLLQVVIWYVGGEGDISSLCMWQQKMLFVIGINVVIAASYTIFPKSNSDQAGTEPVRVERSRPVAKR
jgi:hypothetical protein